MPSDKFKFSAKNGMAPVIKKLYNSHKKLLGRTSTPAKAESKNKDVKKSKEDNNVVVRIIEISEKPEGSHTYENVSFSNNEAESFSEEVFAGVNLSLSSLNLDGEASFSSDTTCVESRSGSSCQSQVFSSDCSTLTTYEETEASISTTASNLSLAVKDLSLQKIHHKDQVKLILKNDPNPSEILENVTVIEVDGIKDKLKTAIDNFDRIINEYASPLSKQPQSKPKLQKSKTCSIIESKCILKKTLSGSSSTDVAFNSLNLSQMTTKSLFHLDRDANIVFPDLTLKNQKFISDVEFWKVSDSKRKNLEKNASVKVENKIKLEKSIEATENDEDLKSIKVKEVVKRLNSLSGDEEKKLSPLKKPSNKHNVKSAGKSLARKKSDCKDKPVQKVLSRNESGKAQLQKTLSNEKKPILKTSKADKFATPKIIDSKSRQSKEFETSQKVINRKPETKLSLIPRAVSCYDVSAFCPKKTLISKIPVKTNLNRTYPSTPGNLHVTLDSTMRCTPISLDKKDKSQSVHNLAAKLNQNDRKFGFNHKRLGGVELERTVSCQNLSKSSRNLSEIVKNDSLSKIEVVKKNFVGNGSNDNNNLIDSTKNSNQIVKTGFKGKSGSKDAVACKKDGGSSLKKSKEEINSYQMEIHNEDSSKTLGKSKKDADILDNKKKLTRNLTYNVNSSGNVPSHKAKPEEVVSGDEKEIVRKFLEDFRNEQFRQNDKEINGDGYKGTFKVKEAKLKGSDAKADVKGADTFGLKKSAFESKFCEADIGKKKQACNLTCSTAVKKTSLKRSETYTKNHRIKEFQAIERIEQSIKTAKQLSVSTNFVSCEILNDIYSRANCIINVEDAIELHNVAELDVRKDEEVLVVANIPKIGIDVVDFAKEKEYLSDDNSDDSGNISNELELEYEDVPRVKRTKATFSSSDSFLSKNSDQTDKGYSRHGDKIFFRTGILTQLESQRDEKLGGMVVSLQAHCRGYLARKKLSQRKLQDLAVRCIQRNVRKFLLVRDWPWWRLLVRVTPLLNVHRTEEELKSKTEELEVLKLKLEKLESERISLKQHNDKLEAKLTEMTADLAEEHSTSTLATERLDAETAERVKLERDLGEVQQKNKALQNASERLEMELLYARSELNGISEDDEEPDGEAVYKQRYERAMRELEFTKRRLQQQHEDDLEQLVGLKKQLEKKLTDAYEEVEEQRQVVGQWKRKVQKLNGEMNDIKLLLEEQSARNNLLEKKQRKFDSELQLMQDELKKEKQAKERLSREKEVVIAEKYTLESQVADLRLEVDLKEEKLNSLQRELDELTYGGKTEEEVALLRKHKIDSDRRLQDQEEELDELAGQVQLLEQAKLKLEMSLEQQRKANKKETQQHEEELEEIRCNSQKKMKAIEMQLENEHEERTILLREKHELERRLTAALENDRNEKACDEAVLQRLKRDLKRTKALLRDTQAQLERQKAENPSKTVIRQLKNQIEDLECARSAAVKTKQILEADLSETQALLEETVRQKSELEEKNNSISREKADLQLQVEENEEELAEVLKKYKATIQQMSLDQLALQEQVALVGELEAERNSLKEQLVELTSKLDSLENMGDASSNVLVRRSELKVKELESKLDLEQTTRSRLEVQISRLKETLEKLQNDLLNSRTKEQNTQDQIRKLQRNLRELRDEHNSALTKESESLLKRKELEKRYEALEAESSTVRTDLRLALKRIEDLQAVIQNDLEDSTENSDSEHDSYSSDDSVNTFLAHHKISSKSNSMQFENQRRLSNTSRSSTSSNLTKDSSYA